MQDQSLAGSFQLYFLGRPLSSVNFVDEILWAFCRQTWLFRRKNFGQFILFGICWLQGSNAQNEFQKNLN